MAFPRGMVAARTRAGAAALVALGVITAIAAALVIGLFGAVRVVETALVFDSVDAASAERGRMLVAFESADAAAQQAALTQAVAAIGGAGALEIEPQGDGVYELLPYRAHFSGDAAVALAEGLPGLATAIRDAGGGTAAVSGGLGAILRPLVDGIETRRGPSAIALGVVALLAVAVVAVAAHEPVRIRRDETALLRARGARAGLMWRLALGEAVPVVVLGGLVGAAAAYALAFWSGDILLPLVPVLAIVVLLVLVAAVSVSIGALRGLDRRVGRGDALAGVTALVLLAVLAGLGAWQFWRAGTPVITLAGGGVGIDPLIAAAPALVLAVFALLVVMLAGPVAALAGVVTRRGRAMIPTIPLTLLARRTARHALGTSTVVFAASTLSLGIVFAGSVQSLGEAPEQVRVGADVRVISVRDDASRADILATEGVDATMRARTVLARGSGSAISVLAVESGRLGEVMHSADGLIDPAALGEVIAPESFGIALPGGAGTLRLYAAYPPRDLESFGSMVDTDGEAPPPPVATVTVLLRSDDGGLVTVTSTNGGAPAGQGTVDGERAGSWATEFALPAGSDWSLVAIDVTQENSGSMLYTELTVELAADGVGVDLGALSHADFPPVPTAAGVTLTLPENDWQKSEPTITRYAADRPAVFPVVVTENLAAEMALSVGSRLSLALAAAPITIDGEVREIVPLLPGVLGGTGVLVDLAPLSVLAAPGLPDNELWIAAEEPGVVAADIEDRVAGIRVDQTDAAAAQRAFTAALIFLFAAAGAILLALVVLLLRRSREDGTAKELGLLSVLGMGTRAARRLRFVEDAAAIVFGVLGGTAAGLFSARLVVPDLVRSSYAGMAEAATVSLAVPWLWIVGAAVAVTLLFLAVAATVRAPANLARTVREAE